ncbi:DUF2325 domain-containing protein [Mobilitalea sibirica]|uniref:DUF2325 domain-containing protein n=1 Tax=Mobilitalea sibirica TaxID=1462919 RepID=A0A8J7H3W9_9FIRM|nr:DUF2325 domain-containing protein [Mobilitalea sibirica]MBH1941805.1 DUF2325 domain-containing protein [Mobilitalea sibirica]
MSILLIGGHERMENIYIKKGKEKGHKLKVMSKMKTDFSKRIGNPDAIIIFTNEVSHKMVIAAESAAKKNDVAIIKCHTSSQSALKNILEEIDGLVCMA